jgi:hypothetical protein
MKRRYTYLLIAILIIAFSILFVFALPTKKGAICIAMILPIIFFGGNAIRIIMALKDKHKN